MAINPQRARFLLGVLFRKIIDHRSGFDKAFREMVRNYGIHGSEASSLYRLSYKILNYYNTVKFMASYNGYGPRLNNVLDYLYVKNFDIESILEDVRELSRSLSNTLRLALLYGYPSWLISDLYRKIPISELENILKSLNKKKKWLRVNTYKTTIEEALYCLEKTGVRVKQHGFFPDVLQLEDPFMKLGNNICYRRGLVIPQDIGSYIATLLTKSIHGEFVDTCSAPGLKLLQVITQSRVTRVISVDLSEKRARFIPLIINRYIGDFFKYIVVVSDAKTLDINVTNTYSLIDAPCSNLGAVYADPVVKLHLSKKTLRKLHLIQKSLLLNTLRYSKVVYYMTCSIHPFEGEEVVERVMSRLGRKIMLEKPIEEYNLLKHFLSKGYKGYDYSNEVFRIQPHIVNGQGFFIAVFRVD